MYSLITFMNFPTSGNKIWFNRAWYYYHNYSKDPRFIGEMYWILKEGGFIPEYVPPNNDSEGNTDNI